ncbi:MAG: hypothetical protein JF616_16365 [Fibrobacteres bacterium]|nr:hypothetical protein [Fibrobacterota bacterium]
MKFLLIALAAILFGCLPGGDRVAGSSTEAGNAGGKLSLANGGPAADVEVALVARGFRSDTAVSTGPGNLPGAYYRTRTGPDGRYAFGQVIPGDYRVMAIAGGVGATIDSVAVRGGDTAFADRVLKPLGGIRGIAKLIGGIAPTHIWVGCRATLKPVRLADSSGHFGVDSLPEGEYDLEPFCTACRQPSKRFRIRVGAGRDTLMADTLKLYPDYFQSFPAADSFTVRPADLPFVIGGKTHRGDEDSVTPIAAKWTWDGTPVAGKDEPAVGVGGIGGTQIQVDSSFFTGRTVGELRLELRYRDTTVVRQWRISFDAEPWIWAMRLVRAGAVTKLTAGDHPVWRISILDTLTPKAEDVAFWGLALSDTGRAPYGDVELVVESKDQTLLENAAPGQLTFVLVPDARHGGRVFRPRIDERLIDFANIRWLDRGRLGFAGDLEPHMLPGVLQVDRLREGGTSQRYSIDRNGKVTETMKLPSLEGTSGVPDPDSLLLYYRRAPAGSAFVWNAPLRASEKAWAVDAQGRAWAMDLPAAALAELKALLAPMAGDPPALPDDDSLPADRPLAYAWSGGRGRVADAETDTLMGAIASWFAKAPLSDTPAFGLPDSLPFRYLAFHADSTGFHYTGDTLILERDSADTTRFREYLSTGSPGRAADSSVLAYSLRIIGDSLIASTDQGFKSHLFGKLGTRTDLFALIGMPSVAPGTLLGLPVSPGQTPILVGIWEGEHVVGNRILASPGLKLVGSNPLQQGSREAGYLYTASGGLESEWGFANNEASADGWIKE